MSSARQLLIFALVGLVNTGVHFLVFLLLLRGFGLPVLGASALGYVAGVINSYFMNRIWTFRVARSATKREFLRFAAVNLVSLLINLSVLAFLTGSAGFSPETGQVVAIAASLAANFAGNKWWAFKSEPDYRIGSQ